MVFNRHCLWRLNPAGTSALLRWTKRSYGRVCQTADLYHVKADWPHQDTRGRSNFSGMLVQKATVIALRIGQLVNKTNPSNGSVAPK